MKRRFFIALLVLSLLLLAPEPRKPVAIVFDPLSNEDEPDKITPLLTEAGYEVTSYRNMEATVDSFKTIPSETSLIVLRVHSSINHGKVWVFTGEPYSEKKHTIDQLVDKVHRARTHPESEYLFALGSTFFLDNLQEMDGAVVLVLGCDAAASEDLAGVFIEKGASVFISWDGPVSLEHTDMVFHEILEQIIAGVEPENAAEHAINKFGRDPHFKSGLVCIKQ
jgi:hypothetical protein